MLELILFAAIGVGFSSSLGLLFNWIKNRKLESPTLHVLFLSIYIFAFTLLLLDIWESNIKLEATSFACESYGLLSSSFLFFIYFTFYPKNKWKPIYFLILLSGIIEILIQLFRNLDNYILGGIINNDTYYFLLNEVLEEFAFIQAILILIFIAWMIWKFRKDAFEGDKANQVQINRRQKSVVLYIFNWVIVLFWGAVLHSNGPDNFIVIFLYLLSSAIILYIGFIGSSEPGLFHNSLNIQENKRRDKMVHDAEANSEAKRILSKISEKELYKNSNLSIKVLAASLQMPKDRLSEIINHSIGKPFRSLINECRIEEAKKLLADDAYQYLSVKGIGKEVGFKSDSSFFEWFKKETQLTPTQFRKQKSSNSPENNS